MNQGSQQAAVEAAPPDIARIPVPSDGLGGQKAPDLSHLPGPPGHWLWGNSRDFMPNPGLYVRGLRRRHGNCFTVGVLRNVRHVVVTGAEANRLVLLDPDDNFSTRWGWEVVHAYFPGLVLLRDFDDHRQHRRIMAPLFKPSALREYLGQMEPIIEAAVAGWRGAVEVYPAQKRLTLDVALSVFAGLEPESDDGGLLRDLSTVLDNVLAMPGPRRWRSFRARDRLKRALRQELRQRRRADGGDLFTRLATRTDDAGRRLSDADVVDHMLGLLFAAHDTTTSALTTMCLKLAAELEWQRRLRRECLALRRQNGLAGLDYDALGRLPLLDAFFRETLRVYSPLQIVPRRAVREFRFEGRRIPANAPILLFPQATHFDSAHFAEPDRFDPGRFLGAPAAHPFAFIPFGKGSHMCLGMHFAAMEVKAVLYRLLLARTLRPVAGDEPRLGYIPLVRPQAPVRLRFDDVREA